MFKTQRLDKYLKNEIFKMVIGDFQTDSHTKIIIEKHWQAVVKGSALIQYFKLNVCQISLFVGKFGVIQVE